ncbi:MAG TPA: hypothetical protein VMM38_06610 [Aridibacter sp.]|nr:hypothetical protein [Aridibacter sp.]
MLKKLSEISFLLLVFSLPFANLPIPFDPGFPFQITEPIFLAASALLALSVLSGGRNIRGGKIYFFIAAYLVFIAVSVCFSEVQRVSAVKAAGIAYLGALTLLSFNCVEGKRMIRQSVLAWIAATVAVSAFSVLVLILFYVDRDLSIVRYGLSHYGTFPPGNYPRIQSLFANPNMLAHYLGIGWVLLLVAKRKEWIPPALFAVSAGIVAIAAIFTLSPGLGVFFLGTGLWMLLVEKAGGVRKAAAAGMIAIALLFVVVTAVRFDKNFAPVAEPSARVLTWSSAASNFVAHPLTGKGVGTFAADAAYGSQRLRDAHNLFLNVAAESGIGAVAAITVFGVWLTVSGFRGRRRGEQGAVVGKGLAIAFAGAFFYQGLAGSFEDARHLWVLAGMLAAVSVESKGEAADE